MWFQYYIGGVKQVVPNGNITLNRFVESIKEPSLNTIAILNEIAEASIVGDKVRKNEWKTKLPYFTPSVIIEDGKTRRYENIVRFTGLAQVDFDGFDNRDVAEDGKYWLFGENQEVVCAYLSPSEKGIKGLVKFPIVTNVDDFQAHYRALAKKYKEDYKIKQFDIAPQNAVLPLFYSHDPEVLYRTDAVEFTDRIEKEIYAPSEYKYEGNVSDKARVFVNNFVDRMNRITDNGHPQLRANCLMLGSIVGAGIVSQMEAEEVAASCIRANPYLSNAHPFEVYFKTAQWAIRRGMQSPYSPSY